MTHLSAAAFPSKADDYLLFTIYYLLLNQILSGELIHLFLRQPQVQRLFQLPFAYFLVIIKILQELYHTYLPVVIALYYVGLQLVIFFVEF